MYLTTSIALRILIIAVTANNILCDLIWYNLQVFICTDNLISDLLLLFLLIQITLILVICISYIIIFWLRWFLIFFTSNVNNSKGNWSQLDMQLFIQILQLKNKVIILTIIDSQLVLHTHNVSIIICIFLLANWTQGVLLVRTRKENCTWLLKRLSNLFIMLGKLLLMTAG